LTALIDIKHTNQADRNKFVKHLLDDIEAMDSMFKNKSFDTDDIRIGFEQEYCLIDYNLRPMMLNLELIEELDDKHFTTELAKFNGELNLDPRILGGDCLTQYENDLIRLLTKANKIAHKYGGKLILTGILPTIKESDIKIGNITPVQRYKALNDVMTRLRGKDFEFRIQGVDELLTSSESVLFESCNTSFQTHLQIDPAQYCNIYNWAQAISGPILACCVNSPIFLGKRLWQETRIALFHQATDIRKSKHAMREERPRVYFGNEWEDGSIVDHYRKNLSHFKIIVTKEIKENSIEVLNRGDIPELQALQLYNGTIYRWNRPCYGITNGKPHIRIEARYLPSGPTIVDEIANAALWIGLMNGMTEEYRNIKEILDFDDIKNNFMKAARSGINAQFQWKNHDSISAKDLLLNELLPLAETGLKKVGVDDKEIDKFLGIIHKRISKERTGAKWILDSFTKLKKEGSIEETVASITEGMYQRQKSGIPVYKWKLADFKEAGAWTSKYLYIHQVMTSDLITVGKDELIDLVKNLMLWSKIHHVPVEDDNGELLGIISTDTLLSYFSYDRDAADNVLMAGDIMDKDPITISPETLTTDAIQLMGKHELTCLPVVVDKKLVGLFTESDYIKFSGYIMQEMNEGDKKSKK